MFSKHLLLFFFEHSAAMNPSDFECNVMKSAHFHCVFLKTGVKSSSVYFCLSP